MIRLIPWSLIARSWILILLNLPENGIAFFDMAPAYSIAHLAGQSDWNDVAWSYHWNQQMLCLCSISRSVKRVSLKLSLNQTLIIRGKTQNGTETTWVPDGSWTHTNVGWCAEVCPDTLPLYRSGLKNTCESKWGDRLQDMKPDHMYPPPHKSKPSIPCCPTTITGENLNITTHLIACTWVSWSRWSEKEGFSKSRFTCSCSRPTDLPTGGVHHLGT